MSITEEVISEERVVYECLKDDIQETRLSEV